eukprot:TRINITY_DN3110_c0_g1::TRINITY_DN3110_c0_g1_i1::g.3523::m.3523 TRINITY_DN3110_c0_g1::TRINITY_DN3110_c0_g1_i1::g.3523  ORF type:complete len:736 (+),score=195.13,sp/Q9NP78/ABCB9_HUMAN/41.68/0.0,ABC_membrane/PF00664.18/3.5e-57,ABC_tran/PF00005.22/2.4e-29,SMC_N/PF02463.14/1.5e-08,ABC_ATPase/PF09818.4/1.8e+03,ABC_ATPase/PF09818.4/0.0006,AAA_21/PF13304.1/30,AAA_21/PF13304.1/0.37,SbcCD_C/PF13558.1/0.07,DUF258/PF03193.11/0.021,AAA_16/PF13191.1/0.048,Zeta_toxin/PF06414.7/3e+03,Zeta_toxin/PF06414.7/0.22,Z
MASEWSNADWESYHAELAVVDLWLLSVVRLTFSLALPASRILFYPARKSSVGTPPHRLFIPGIVISLGCIVFLLVKAFLRLLSEGPVDSHPGSEDDWFWSFIGFEVITCSLNTWCWWKIFKTDKNAWVEPQKSSKENELDKLLGSERDGQDKKTSAEIGKLIRLMYPEKFYIFLAFICLTIAAGAQVLIPHFMGQVLDTVAIEEDRDAFKEALIMLMVTSVVSSVFSGCRGALFSYTMARMQLRVRENLFESILSQEIGFFDATKTGDIVSRLNADASKMCDLISLNINIFLRSFMQAAGVLVFMLYLSWKLTIVTFVAVPVVVVLSKFYGDWYRNQAQQVQDEIAKANSVAEEVLSTMKTVRSFANEEGELRRYKMSLMAFYQLQLNEAKMYVGYLGTISLLPNLVTVLVLYYGGHLVLNGEISGGNLVSFLFYQNSLSDAFNTLGNIFTSLMQAVGAADKVFLLLERKPKMSAPGMFKPQYFRGGLELRNVTFAYPTRQTVQVLQDFNLVVRPGEVVALVGSSGGGKTSTINLLERFYDPAQGDVLVDNVPVREYDPRFLHQQMVLVGQEPVLYACSIEKNIVYGLADHQWTREKVVQAAKLANAHNFIESMPDGYDTNVGERGTQLSGGQKQRIAIARALVRDPSILLLDEATSALDAESESLVQQAIDNMMKDRTVVVIAHRLSTVKNADRIVVIDKGTIVEEGSHASLLDRQGVYYNLVQKQLQTKDLLP